MDCGGTFVASNAQCSPPLPPSLPPAPCPCASVCVSLSQVTQVGERLIVQSPRGDLEFDVLPRFSVPGAEDLSGGLVAPMPGKVIEIRVAVGDSIEPRQTLILLEAMKMEHPMQAADAGTVSEILVTVGEQVENGALLLIVESEDDMDEASSGAPGSE